MASFDPFYQRSFYRISSKQERLFKMRWKHQHQQLPQTGAPERASFQRAGGQRDHAWSIWQWPKKTSNPTSVSSVGVMLLWSVVVIADRAHSSVLIVTSLCTPDTPFITEMPVLQDFSSHYLQPLLCVMRPFVPVVRSGLERIKYYPFWTIRDLN